MVSNFDSTLAYDLLKDWTDHPQLDRMIYNETLDQYVKGNLRRDTTAMLSIRFILRPLFGCSLSTNPVQMELRQEDLLVT